MIEPICLRQNGKRISGRMAANFWGVQKELNLLLLEGELKSYPRLFSAKIEWENVLLPQGFLILE